MANLNGVKVNNAKLPLLKPYEQAGVNPKTKLPERCSEDGGAKVHIKKLVRIQDEQDALNSVRWYNLPKGLDGNLIERILYYRGQGMFFYMESAQQFFFLPYTLDGNIDVYGRFTDVTPLPFNGTAAEGNDKEVKPWISGLVKHCVYDEIDIMDLTEEDLLNSCVLLHDYSCQISQTNISRQILNDPICDLEADMLPFARTAALNSTGVQGMRVNSEDEQSNVNAASNAINRAALNGKKYVPIVGNIDFQELTSGNIAKSDEFLMLMQSIDNYRLSTHGLDSGGIFQKQAHMLESENQMNASKSSFAMQDRLYNRQRFCDLVNSIWGLGIYCDASEAALGMDQDMDGDMMSDEPDTQASTQNMGGETDESV